MFNKYSLSCAVAALAFSAAPASAADLGGDCCADLEERVAVLEATTARKGNRKVSLTISGFVNQTLSIWDDGVESDAYVGTNTDAQTRFRFVGNAKIDSTWSAGYLIEIGVFSAFNHTQSATSDDGTGSGMNLRKSELWIKNAQLGKVSLGLGSSATDDLAFYGQLGVSAAAFQPDVYAGGGFQFRNSAGALTGLTIRGMSVAWDNPRTDRIRYDSPTIAGFVLSASWGEDDFSDVALRYNGTAGDFKLKGGAGYSVNDDGAISGVSKINSLILTGGIMHSPTGLFVHAMYRDDDFEGVGGASASRADQDSWQIQAGIQQRWNTLGKTTIFGAYQEHDDAGVAFGATSSLERTSVGIVQDIDAAAMKLYVTFDHYEGENSGSALSYQDFDVVTFGGFIAF